MSTIKNQFLINPSITFLNHGSFGATPKPVFDEYQRWQLELERQPVEFLGRRAPELLENARNILGQYLGVHYNDLVFTTNVTEAINIVARSLKLCPSDEVLTTNMEYGAMDRTWRFLARQSGFKYINQPVSVPVTSEAKFVDDFLGAVTPRTKVIFLSHISSPTALIMPVKAICRWARDAGILTIVDGAHAPGQINLNLIDIDADFYGANLHKWLCAPKGAGFLYARPEVQSLIEPLIVSWGWQSETPGPSQFVDYLQWTGTRDLAAFLSVPAAIQFQKDNNWVEIRQMGHQLAAQTLGEISHLSGKTPIYSPDSNWFAQMAACPLPDSVNIIELKKNLYDEFKIEIPILQWENEKIARVSYQAYNDPSDMSNLLRALGKLLAVA